MRALADRLCSFAGRGPGSDAERRAARALHDDLRREGHEAWVETYWVRPQWALSLLAGAALAIGASVIAPSVPEAAIVAGALAALHLAVEALGRPGPLRWLTYRRATQNVLVLPRDEERIALWICAHYDAPQRGSWGGRLLSARPWLALCALVIAGAAGARIAGAEGLIVGLVQFIPTVVLLVAFAVAADTALSAVTPGEDEAAAVAVAVELFRELHRAPPAQLAPALLLHGAGEADPLGLRAHLRHDRPRAEDNVLIEVRGAQDDPQWAAAHPQLQLAAGGAGRGHRTRGAVSLGGLPTLLVGRPQAASDEALEATLDFLLAVVEDLDAELAAHEATLPRPRAA
jgi:hypothetical protein